MGITLDDLNAQRAMLARGEEKRKAAKQAEERERLRDTFAAAALTGLLANGDYNPSTPVLAFRMADAMLRERARNGSVEGCETVQSDHIPDAGKWWKRREKALLDALVPPDHDAAPAARASESPCAGHAGTGGTPVTKPMPVFVSGSGSVTPVAYQENDEKRVFYDTTGGQSDRTQPIENGPDADSRVWETPAKTDTTPPRNGKPTEGSVPGECSVLDSRNWKEPVAWAVMQNDWYHDAHLDYYKAVKLATAANVAGAKNPWNVVPLYRSPTLTDAEREAVEAAAWACGNCDGFGGVPTRPAVYNGNEIAATLRNLLERIGGER